MQNNYSYYEMLENIIMHVSWKYCDFFHNDLLGILYIKHKFYLKGLIFNFIMKPIIICGKFRAVWPSIPAFLHGPFLASNRGKPEIGNSRKSRDKAFNINIYI